MSGTTEIGVVMSGTNYY